MFACLYAPPRGLAFRSNDGVPRAKCVTDQLVSLAREYSPRLEIHGDNLVVLEITGLSMFDDARELGANLRRAAADRGLYLRIAVASTRTAVLLVVQDRSGLTVIEPGREEATLAILPLEVLRALAQRQAQASAIRTRRGVRASGAALAIPAFTLLSTIRRWGLRTLGDLASLPSTELFERLGSGGMALQRFARGEDEGPLVLLDLESHPPHAGVDPATVVIDPVPARIQQFSLLERKRPDSVKVTTLVARLTALAGEGRCGAPALIDSDTVGFEMRAFVSESIAPSSRAALRCNVE
jgi:hypothetical protein